MFDRITAKEKSKTILRTRSLADAAGLFVIQTALSISLLLSLVPVFGLLPLCLALLFHAGMNRSALRMNRGDKNVRILDILHAGDRLGRYIAITLWQALFLILWQLPTAAMATLALFLLTVSSNAFCTAVVVILLIAAVYWSLYIFLNKLCQYALAYFIAEDDRDLPALDCIRESGRRMIGHKGELFVTWLSFFGWNLISLLPGASVFVSPYQYLTYASIYEQLSGTFQPATNMPWFQNGQKTAENEERSVVILSGTCAGASIAMQNGEEITIGRDPAKANIVTASTDTSVSGLHCRIRYDAQTDKYIVVDHSTNGTYLNNEKLLQNNGTYAPKGSFVKLADGAMILRLS